MNSPNVRYYVWGRVGVDQQGPVLAQLPSFLPSLPVLDRAPLSFHSGGGVLGTSPLEGGAHLGVIAGWVMLSVNIAETFYCCVEYLTLYFINCISSIDLRNTGSVHSKALIHFSWEGSTRTLYVCSFQREIIRQKDTSLDPNIWDSRTVASNPSLYLKHSSNKKPLMWKSTNAIIHTHLLLCLPHFSITQNRKSLFLAVYAKPSFIGLDAMTHDKAYLFIQSNVSLHWIL